MFCFVLFFLWGSGLYHRGLNRQAPLRLPGAARGVPCPSAAASRRAAGGRRANGGRLTGGNGGGTRRGRAVPGVGGRGCGLSGRPRSVPGAGAALWGRTATAPLAGARLPRYGRALPAPGGERSCRTSRGAPALIAPAAPVLSVQEIPRCVERQRVAWKMWCAAACAGCGYCLFRSVSARRVAERLARWCPWRLVAVKLTPPAYFRGSYHRYKEHNSAVR